jgi:hypothetical protein
MPLYEDTRLPGDPPAATPELEFRAAEALFEQTPAFRSHVRDIAAFLEGLRDPARAALMPEIRELPAPHPELTLRTAAVDSSHKPLSTAGMTVVWCAAFRTSASNSEDHRFAHAPVDAGFEVEPIARLMRCHMETELLTFERQGEDQITILDNSFLTLPASASQAWMALERCEPDSLSYDTLRVWCEQHLGADGSLARMLGNGRVIALPKVGAAQSLIDDIYDRVGLADDIRRRPAARAQHDRLLLRFVLRPGEYLAPRPLVDPGGAGDRRWRRFFGDFPGRDVVQAFFDAPLEDPEHGIDVVYVRPRRAVGAADGPVMRVELHRPLARNEDALHQILLTLQDSLDGEHPEPVPQLLADHYAKGAVRHAPAAVTEAVYGDLLDSRDDPEFIDLVTALFQEQRS